MPDPTENRAALEYLITGYEAHRYQYLNSSPSQGKKYNETGLRREFLDKFFSLLGWDVDNNSRNSETYKDVVHEDPIKLRGTTGHIDYSFRIGGTPKFIVEAKKPATRIKDDKAAALQLRRYAWNAKLPLNILTNFEEWAIYDCTKKPSESDTAGTARIEYFTYKELRGKWDYLVDIFSKERILQGSFDRFVAQAKGKKGTVSVDKDILATIEGWRDLLEKNIALRNSALSVDELNIAVQRIIDRIIFLRISEDRGIEKYETLRALLEGDGVYPRLCKIFDRADGRYNSGLFHFSDEPGWDELPDRLTLGLKIDDKVLKEIIRQLYYPDTQYEFSVIPPAILGQVYEQFLGKVIRLTDGHQAKVEYKPEVKKAGGVFYTPEYIVDYIVKETVGRLVEGKTPAEVAAIRVLDPACGSGSFLLGAYQFLLDWHLDWYIRHLAPKPGTGRSATDPAIIALLPTVEVPAKRGKKTERRPIDLPIYLAGRRQDEKGMDVWSDWKLTTAERKRILLSNLYGVDIDQQAVEVTKLSLLLKVLEDETEETITGQMTLGTERALPSLHKNIKCGNSLIGPDILSAGPLTDEEIARINPFEWTQGFPAIMAAGGFDAVIGNPPYVRMESFKEIKDYLRSNYQVYSGRADLYAYFIERALSVLKPKALFGIIVSNKWIRANYGQSVRDILRDKEIHQLIDFGDLDVFEGATTYPCIIVFSNTESDQSILFTDVENLDFSSLDDYVHKNAIEINRSQLNGENWTLYPQKLQEITEKIFAQSILLGEYIENTIFRGVVTGLNSAFIISDTEKEAILRSDSDASRYIKPMLAGKDIKRYSINDRQRFLIYTYHGVDISSKSGIIEYLKPRKRQLESRATEQKWFELQQPQYAFVDYFTSPKIVYPEICNRPSFSFDETGYFLNNKCFGIPKADLYLLGLLNSQLTAFLFEIFIPKLRGGFFMPGSSMLVKLPIHPIDWANADDVAKHDRMVGLVERMLELHRRLPSAATDHEKQLLEMQVKQTDKEIDAFVYDLYGLTLDEIAIVEAAMGRKG